MQLLVIVIGACAFAAASATWLAYYAYEPLWVEHAAYGMLANVQFYDASAHNGYLTALRGSLLTRHVLQPALLGLIDRRLLAWPHSHLFVTGATLWLFLALLGRYVRERTGSRPLAITACILFCTMPGLYEETGGMGVPWPDYQSMFLLASAALSTALFAVNASDRWLALAGTCLTLGALARDTGAVYGTVMIGPPVAWLLVRTLRRVSVARAVVMILSFVVPASPTAWLLGHHVEFFRRYYMTSNAEQLRHPLGLVLSSIVHSLVSFGGVIPLAVAFLLLIVAMLTGGSKKWSSADIVIAYAPLSYFVLLVANGYNASGVTKEVMYIAPGLIAAAVSIREGVDVGPRNIAVLVAALVTVCVGAAALSVRQAYDRAVDVSPTRVALRRSQRELAQALAALPRQVWWQSYCAYDWGQVVSVLTLEEFDRYQPSENRWFHNKKSYWDAVFPNRDLGGLEAYILSETERRVDVAIVLKDPDREPPEMEHYSFSIASWLSKRVVSDPNWRHYRDVDTLVTGPLSLYINLRSTRR